MTKPTPAQIEAEIARQGRIANWGHPAAAEVGDDKDEAIPSYTMTQWREKILAHENATIERCALVAFDAIENEELAFAVVAAIRALKDK